MRGSISHTVASLLLLLVPATVLALEPEQEIEALVTAVEVSGCRFHRNGDVHDSAAAADHMRLKLKRGRRYARTTEDFIANLATQSSWTGRPYLIECQAGQPEPLNQWLTARLESLRSAEADR